MIVFRNVRVYWSLLALRAVLVLVVCSIGYLAYFVLPPMGKKDFAFEMDDKVVVIARGALKDEVRQKLGPDFVEERGSVTFYKTWVYKTKKKREYRLTFRRDWLDEVYWTDSSNILYVGGKL